MAGQIFMLVLSSQYFYAVLIKIHVPFANIQKKKIQNNSDQYIILKLLKNDKVTSLKDFRISDIFIN